MDRLTELAESEGIFLSYCNLQFDGRDLYGLYFYDPQRGPFILLDKSIRVDHKLHRSVMAEELGHHFTVPQTNILLPYTSYAYSLSLERDERRAIRWACDFLMPTQKFVTQIQSCGGNLAALADEFQVTPWLVRWRITFAQFEGYLS